MDAKPIIKQTLGTSDHLVQKYVGDLNSDELTMRPAEGMNPIAWQLGHLIEVERKLVDMLKPGSSPELPSGFAEAHGKNVGMEEDTSKYLSKDEYLKYFGAQRAATLAVLDGLTDEEMEEAPANTLGGMCSTKGQLLNFLGAHVLMHVGQFVPIRRKAGKAIVV